MDPALLNGLYCPFSSVVNENMDEVEDETLAWAENFELFRDERAYAIFRAVGFGRLAARCHPYSPLRELRLISDFYAWMFFQDDLRDESEAGLSPDRLSDGDRRSLEILEGDGPSRSDAPAARATFDLRERFDAVAPGPMWSRRFVRAVRNFLEATVWEASNRARNIVPDPEPYLRMRPLTGGLLIDEELISLSAAARLPRWILDDESVRRLSGASMNAVCWSNDVISLDKELAHGDVHNLVVVLRDAEGLTLDEATRRVIEMHNREVRDFLELSARLPSFGDAVDDNLANYTATLRARMRGNLDWSFETGRYGSLVQAESLPTSTSYSGSRND